MGVKVQNLTRLQAKLRSLDPVTRDALVMGVYQAGLAVEATAKNRVPVDTGQLRGSINTNTRVITDGAEAMIGTNKEYALYVEMGTSKMKAQPYMRPALQSNKRKAKGLIMTEIVKAHRSLR